MEVEVEDEWGTWEELILVSAVLRHGINQWDAVVAELRARTFAPLRFTPEVCKEKYEGLQQHYSTCSDLLEGLRKERIAELRRTLEKSNGSIGFLQAKLQTLKADKEHSSSVDYQSSPFESPAQTSVGQSSGKETSKDGLSAGSFTQEVNKIQSPPIHTPVTQTLQQPSDSLRTMEDFVTNIQMEWGIGVKKKRGKRKRRGSSQDVKEDNFDELSFKAANPDLPVLSSIKVEPTSECDLTSPSYVADKFSQATDGLKCSELTRIFDMIASNEHASIFRRKLDSQKQARYRTLVRQHMDLEAIKCKIDKQTITSTKELLRDLLLLATNAAIFYSRNTREHKDAVILQGVIKKLITESKKSSIPKQAPAVVTTSSASASELKTIPKKPKTAKAENHKSLDKLKNDESGRKAAQAPQKANKTSKLNASQQARHARNTNDVSRKQPQTKLASVNSHNTKDGSLHLPLVKLTPTDAQNHKDGSTHQCKVKSASVRDSKERKRARKL